MSRMKRLIETIRLLMEGEFCGYIKINFSQGSLGRIEKSEELEDAATIENNNGSEKRGRRTDKKDVSLFIVSMWLLFSFAICATHGLKESQEARTAFSVLRTTLNEDALNVQRAAC